MKAAAIIPAYNEAKRVSAVINVVKKHRLISEVIVVDDGSEDDTVQVAQNCGVQVVELTKNRGKGGAMQAGVERTEAEILLFLDADLVGLELVHIEDLLTPVLSQQAAMSVGLFTQGRMTTDLAQLIAPFLSGQRCLHRNLLNKLPDLELIRFGVEVALTRYAKQNNLVIAEVELDNLTHVMKEEKLGLWQGSLARLKMYWELISTLF